MQGPFLAVDYGTVRCGLAWCGPLETVLPLRTCATASLLQALTQLAEEKAPAYILWGLPLSSDGSENALCQEIRAQAQYLPQYPHRYVSERFSTQGAALPHRHDDALAACRIAELALRWPDRMMST